MIAKIKEKKEVAKGTLEVTFELPESVDFKPGQYFTIRLLNAPYNDSKGLQRHFSIVNSPTVNTELTLATRLRDSAFKKSLQEFPKGTEVEILNIEGSFLLPEDTKKPLVFIAGGIGITPFMSMLRYTVEKKLPYDIILIYSNRDQESAAFLRELQMLVQDNINLRLILIMTQDHSWTGETKRIDADFIKKYISDVNSKIYYIAGPPAMVEGVFSVLQQGGVEPANIMTDNFTGY